jgi:hypothetical protein
MFRLSGEGNQEAAGESKAAWWVRTVEQDGEESESAQLRWAVRYRAGAERRVAELYEQREHSCSGTQQRQFKELRSVLNDVHKHIVAVSKALKIPLAKPHKINGRISPIRLFHKVWVLKLVVPNGSPLS